MRLFLFSMAAILMLLFCSCRSQSTPELWDSLTEPGISQRERSRREERLVRRLQKEQQQPSPAATTTSPSQQP